MTSDVSVQGVANHAAQESCGAASAVAVPEHRPSSLLAFLLQVTPVLVSTGLLLAVSSEASACSCFSPEVRTKTAQEALVSARMAVYGRVVEVRESGKAKVLVLESFKGPPVGSTLEIIPDASRCEAPAPSVGEEALLLSFRDPVTLCDRHPPEHYLLEEFRSSAAKAR